MPRHRAPQPSPLPEYLRRSVLLRGRWHPDKARLVLELRCGFQTFDGLDPVADSAELHLHGVAAVEQWHRHSVRGIHDGTTSRVPAPSPSPASPLQPWPYPDECDLCDVMLAHAGWRPERAPRALVLYQEPGGHIPAEHRRLVIGLFHPDFMDHQVWLVIDHREHRVMVGGEELDLAAWLSAFQSWIRRSATE